MRRWAPELPRRPVEAELLSAAPGVYEAPAPGPLTNFGIATGTGSVQVSARDGDLWLHSRRGPLKDDARLVPADPNDPAFFLLETKGVEPVPLVLRRDGNGAVNSLLLILVCGTELVRNDMIAPWG